MLRTITPAANGAMVLCVVKANQLDVSVNCLFLTWSFLLIKLGYCRLIFQ